jgi:nitrogen-specific signal transduction histidine kinase
MVHVVGDDVWQAQNKDTVFVEACRGILSNSDYVLVWIGIPDENNQVIPVTANGSTTMNRQELDECMGALLTAAEENSDRYDAAGKALKQKSPVIIRDILSGLPKGPFKNTPFSTSKPDCIALPMIYDQQIFGVINIYSIAPQSFSDEEAELLKGMTREIVFAIFALTAKESNKAMARMQAARKTVFENNSDLILVINAEGTIAEANPAAENKLKSETGILPGSNINDFFHGASLSGSALNTIAKGCENICLEFNDSKTEYMVNISPLENQPDESDTYLLIARDISEQKAHKTDTIRASRLAAMGELSVGVANEINNLTNGLINYSQILSEEIADTAGNNNQSIELLNNVIKEGERISQIVQQLLFFNTTGSQIKEGIKLNKIIEDSLALTKHQFKYDAIEVSIHFPTTVPSVRVNVQEMQHIFLNLLSNARYALNQRYPGQHPQKRLEIKGEITSRDGRQHLKITFIDYGVGIPPNIINKVFDPFFSTKPRGIGTGLGLSISKSIMEDNDGTFEIESIEDDHTSIIMELPLVT